MTQPFPHIPRLPGERKLEGAPRAASESVFNHLGMPAALELHTATYGHNSKERRLIIDRATKGSATEESLGAMATSLELAKDIFVNTDKARYAGFLATTLHNRIESYQKNTEHADRQPAESEPKHSASYELYDAATRNAIINAAETESYRSGVDPYWDPTITFEVGQLCKLTHRNLSDVTSLGARYAHRYFHPATMSPDDIMVNFKNAAFAIDKAKRKAVGQKAPTFVSNQVVAAMASELAYQVYEKPGIQDALFRWRTAALEAQDPTVTWLTPKFDTLLSDVTNFSVASAYLKRFTEGKSENDATLQRINHGNEAPPSSEEVHELFDMMNRLRHYTIKPAYFTGDALTKDESESWVMLPNNEFTAMYKWPSDVIANPFYAISALSSINRPSAIEVNPQPVQYGKDIRTIYASFEGFDPLIILGIFSDGEVGVYNAGNVRDMRAEFKNAGREDVYLQLQSTLASYVFDLVMPAEIVETLLSYDGAPQGNARHFEGHPGKAKLPPIRNILLPRLRYLRHNFSAAQQEIDSENSDTSHRIIRKHEVVGHIRRLPPNYHPTPGAVEYARSLGFQLGPNETFVKEHKRGDSQAGIITSHHGIQAR